MKVETGDIVLYGPIPGKESFFQRAIKTMGSISTHNEPVYVDRDGVAWVACAEPPKVHLIALDDRIEAAKRKECILAIVRPTVFVNAGRDYLDYRTYRSVMAGVIRFTNEEMAIKYDWRGIRSQGRNFLRNLFGLRPVGKQDESKVWCSEYCEKMQRVSGWDPQTHLPKQQHFAPIHYERLVLHGDLGVVDDYGLADLLLGPAQ